MSVASSPASRAVFLSYASQDAEAARRICETPRAAGVEVWLEADGGLEHGDEWDATIRRQIKDCVLFIPLISANTQARIDFPVAPSAGEWRFDRVRAIYSLALAATARTATVRPAHPPSNRGRNCQQLFKDGA